MTKDDEIECLKKLLLEQTMKMCMFSMFVTEKNLNGEFEEYLNEKTFDFNK
jgi:hypothetical protein